jgi:hypothetical protein
LQRNSNIARPNPPTGAVFEFDDVTLVVLLDLQDVPSAAANRPRSKGDNP